MYDAWCMVHDGWGIMPDVMTSLCHDDICHEFIFYDFKCQDVIFHYVKFHDGISIYVIHTDTHTEVNWRSAWCIIHYAWCHDIMMSWCYDVMMSCHHDVLTSLCHNVICRNVIFHDIKSHDFIFHGVIFHDVKRHDVMSTCCRSESSSYKLGRLDKNFFLTKQTKQTKRNKRNKRNETNEHTKPYIEAACCLKKYLLCWCWDLG